MQQARAYEASVAVTARLDGDSTNRASLTSLFMLFTRRAADSMEP